jgi:hypothetical protein
VLYWLSTDTGTKEEYRNPHAIGAFLFGGWVHWPTDRFLSRLHAGIDMNELLPPLARTKGSRRALVEHRPPVDDSMLVTRAAACGAILVFSSFLLILISCPSTYAWRLIRCGLIVAAWHDRLEGNLEASILQIMYSGRWFMKPAM